MSRDGTIGQTMTTALWRDQNSHPAHVTVLADGSVRMCFWGSDHDEPGVRLLGWTPEGAPDETLGTGGRRVLAFRGDCDALVGDALGGILLLTGGTLHRLQANGDLDPAFVPANECGGDPCDGPAGALLLGRVSTIRIGADSTIWIAGIVPGGWRLSHLLPQGMHATDLGGDGSATIPATMTHVQRVLLDLDPSGRPIGGPVRTDASVPDHGLRSSLRRIDPERGSVDLSFAGDGELRLRRALDRALPRADGRLLTFGRRATGIEEDYRAFEMILQLHEV